jgi:hypothetical protein
MDWNIHDCTLQNRLIGTVCPTILKGRKLFLSSRTILSATKDFRKSIENSYWVTEGPPWQKSIYFNLTLHADINQYIRTSKTMGEMNKE